MNCTSLSIVILVKDCIVGTEDMFAVLKLKKQLHFDHLYTSVCGLITISFMWKIFCMNSIQWGRKSIVIRMYFVPTKTLTEARFFEKLGRNWVGIGSLKLWKSLNHNAWNFGDSSY